MPRRAPVRPAVAPAATPDDAKPPHEATPVPPPSPGTRPADLTLLQADLRLAGRLDARFFALLRALRDTGSLRRAAQTAGYSYKGAWLVLEAASAQTLAPLFETATGGRGGGGSTLTPAAEALLAGWDALQQRHRAFLQAEEARLLTDAAFAGLLRRTAMRTTARNQFAGTVAGVEADAWTALVQVTIAGDHALTVATSTAAVHRLGLAAGREARVLVKASSVTLGLPDASVRHSAGNRLAGTVARIDPGPVTDLVVVRLPGGAGVTATVPHEAVEALSLRIGQPAVALFEATAALLAVAG